MDFARKQLEKYGWTDGKGLGKHENGIAQALKPKLKRSVTGIGHDAASDFTEHWWTQLYNKAAGNVEVEEKNGKTKKIKTKDTDEFEITNSTWKIKKKKNKSQNEVQYADFFVRKAVLTNGGAKMEKSVDSSGSESEGEDGVKKDVFKMTDEELFAACEGRTAHKGARHGLKATGKLARIAQQEQMLLTQSQYDGYSHAKRRKQNEETTCNQEVVDTSVDETVCTNKKEKKKKKNKSCDDDAKAELSLPEDNEIDAESVASVDRECTASKKSKKIKNIKSDTAEISEDVPDIMIDNSLQMTKKKKKKSKDIDGELLAGEDHNKDFDTTVKKKKKKTTE